MVKQSALKSAGKYSYIFPVYKNTFLPKSGFFNGVVSAIIKVKVGFK